MKAKYAMLSALAAILLVVAGLILVLKQYYTKAGKPISWMAEADLIGWSLMFSIAVGIVLSVWLIGLVIRKLLAGKPDLLGLSTAAHTGSKIGAYLGWLASYPFALFLGFVVGGSLGGGWGEVLLGKAGIVLGIGLGLFVVVTLISVIATLVGFVLGGFAEKLVKAARA